MTGLVRKATLFCVCGLLTAGVALAHVPDPANSDCVNVGAATLSLPCTNKAILYTVGNSGGVPDPVGEFCLTVRDNSNIPLENSSVVIGFADCNVQLCTDQLDPDVIVDCVAKTVRKLTDANGVACFRVQGKAYSAGTLGCNVEPKDCVTVVADGVLMCTGDAPILDLVSQGGEDGLNPNDLSEFQRLWLVCGSNALRGNYDCSNQVLDPNDLSIFQQVWLVLSGTTANCAGGKSNEGPKCP